MFLNIETVIKISTIVVMQFALHLELFSVSVIAFTLLVILY